MNAIVVYKVYWTVSPIQEFFTESHWSKLPAVWQESLNHIKVEEASLLLLTSPFDHHRYQYRGYTPIVCHMKWPTYTNFHRKSARVEKVYPLSLLAFVATAHALSVPRQPQQYGRGVGAGKYAGQNSGAVSGRGRAQVDGLDHMFRRHVKLKKQHEIRNLVEVRETRLLVIRISK